MCRICPSFIENLRLIPCPITKSVAIVGWSTNPEGPSHWIDDYLERNSGWKVYLIKPLATSSLGPRDDLRTEDGGLPTAEKPFSSRSRFVAVPASARLDAHGPETSARIHDRHLRNQGYVGSHTWR